MKIISYSLFKGTDPLAELFYVRGAYFNWKMNQLVYPDWITSISMDKYMMEKYADLVNYWVHSKTIQVRIGWDRRKVEEDTHCMKMLWRMKPIFESDVDCVICRDTDALTSAREAKAVDKWLESSKVLFGLQDNPAHSIPLMGGMSGFKAKWLRETYGTFNDMIAKAKRPIDGHGSDQHFLNDVIYTDFMCSYGSPECWLGKKEHGSDLCTSFIGSAGCNEMETLRFLRSNISDWVSDKEIWKQYPEVFYWHNV